MTRNSLFVGLPLLQVRQSPCVYAVQLFELLNRIVGIARVVSLETGVDTHREPNPALLETVDVAAALRRNVLLNDSQLKLGFALSHFFLSSFFLFPFLFLFLLLSPFSARG